MRLLFTLLIILLLQNCRPKNTISIPAFYHWQTKLSLSKTETTYLDRLNIQKLYIKFFDVDWDANLQQAVPSAELIWEANEWENIEIIPTVFITNRTLVNTKREGIPELASKLSKKITDLVAGKDFEELQIDCDWTKSTKEKYFLLLAALKKLHSNQILSATIRLHQVKFQEATGVPPVDRGMLMYYNIGNINDWESENSIYEAELAAQYLGRLKKYPLALDVVLPLFHWGLIYRDEKLFKIVNNLAAVDLADEKRFQQIATNRYKVIKATYLEGHYLYEDDQIRLEQISERQLQIANQQLLAALAKEDRTIAFYHLDEEILKHWNVDILIDLLKGHETSQ
ncbi:MAG: hypothetical protein AAF806_27585 [Bacteroidota bacterium]